jgi:hypothetical protein
MQNIFGTKNRFIIIGFTLSGIKCIIGFYGSFPTFEMTFYQQKKNTTKMIEIHIFAFK